MIPPSDPAAGFKILNHGVQPRQRRISEKLWESHKVEILNKFRSSSLAGVKAYMESNHGFVAE